MTDKGDWEKGCVQVYTGDGKGKTTAALGLTVRAVGAGLRVFVGQFIKGMRYSEVRALAHFGDAVTVRQFGRGCFIYNAPSEEDIRLAEEGLVEVRRVLAAGEHRVVILDEVNVAVTVGLFSVDRVLELIDARPSNVELVLTGRGASPEVIARADLVTEMRELKHYYTNGIGGRKGIES
jgi:cob(I)alamin adenosyltransferase